MASTLGAWPRAERTTLSALSIAVLMGLTSCTFPGFHHQKARVFIPPPVAPARPSTRTPPQLPPPAADTTRVAAELPPLPESLPRLGGPPIPPPKRPVAVAPKPAPPPTPVAVEPAPTPPKPVQIYTAAQVREYNRTIDDSLERVRRALAAVAAKNLNPEQAQIAESVRTFQRQAESAREQDLVTAVSLARRADLLARDLMARLP